MRYALQQPLTATHQPVVFFWGAALVLHKIDCMVVYAQATPPHNGEKQSGYIKNEGAVSHSIKLVMSGIMSQSAFAANTYPMYLCLCCQVCGHVAKVLGSWLQVDGSIHAGLTHSKHI